jgi:AcrR family transcriptional regulator
MRITEAAVELHGTLGPANTRLTDVAKLAGVSRMTVYNHFPTERDLFFACSTHWATRNPFPDPASWAGIEDPSERLVGALKEFYGWYGLKEDMLGKVFRDTPIVPALAQVMDEFWWPYAEGVLDTLSAGWSVRSADAEALRTALRLVVTFDTWRVLTESALDSEDAAELAGRMVIGAFER